MSSASSLPGSPPGPELAAALDGIDPGTLTDDQLIDVMAAWRRQASWAQAGELAAVAELARRRESAGRTNAEFTSEEVGLALGMSPRSADAHLEFARALAGRLPLTRRALAEGRIDLVKARVIAQGTRVVDDEVARAVERRVLPGAEEVTPGRLRARVERAVIAVDPAGADERRKAAEADRRVECYDTGNGTAVLTGVHLPAAAAIAADDRLHGIARSIKAGGDPRTLEQLSADVFLALLLGAHPASGLPIGRLTPSRPTVEGGSARCRADEAGTSPDDLSADAAPFTGADPGEARVRSGRPSGRAEDLGRPHGGVRPDRGREHAPPGGSPTGGGPAGVPLGEPAEMPLGDPADIPLDEPAGTSPDGLAADVFRAVGARIGGVQVTVPLTTLLGLADAPGQASGYGVVTAQVARQLVRAAATDPGTRWCVTVTGPDGRIIHHGHPGYRPPTSMAHLVKALHPTCCFPGCARPAAACDVDHRIPYEHGGPTCPCNLQPLCRRHHRAKAADGWRLVLHEGRFAWTTPAGKTYTAPPDDAAAGGPATGPPGPRDRMIDVTWRRCVLVASHRHRPRTRPDSGDRPRRGP